jgi:selenocysteine lyase/cysteine desulfurase
MKTFAEDQQPLLDFPVVRRRVFLAHAAVSPLPQVAVEAMARYAARAAEEGQFGHLHAELLARTRQQLARLLGVAAEEVAFVTSTSTGLSLVAAGLDWAPGDTVIIPEDDFPANRHAWLALRRRGVEVRFLPHRADRGITVQDVERLLDASTRLVSLSSIHYLTGLPADIDGIGQLLHHRRVLFCVDAIQSLGAMPTSARHADFVAAGAHKWLLGPQGIGLLVVRQQHLDRLRPSLLGWKSQGEHHQDGRAALADSAARYEPGSLNVIGIVGLNASLSLLESIGRDAIVSRLLELRRRLVDGVQTLGYEVLGRPDREIQTGITSFTHPSRDLAALRRTLERRSLPIVVSERETTSGTKVLRFAPHVYNTTDDVEALLAALA